MFNSHPINKNLAIENFKLTLWQARRDSLLSKLLRKSSCLKSFEESSTNATQQKRYLGVREIPTDKITGTVGRSGDFDGRFRPLKRHLRDRWVTIAVRANERGWPAIEVFKLGEDYFVLDGHHRTSYARTTGIAFIDAEVWEIEQQSAPKAASVIDLQKQLFSQKALAEEIVVYDTMVCCCA